MAGKRIVKAIALVNLKYNKDVKKIGEELSVKIKDVQDLTDRGLIEPMEDISDENTEDVETEDEQE